MNAVDKAAIVYVILCLIFGYSHWRIIKRDERKEAERLLKRESRDKQDESNS